MSELNEKQRLFVAEYVASRNATAAAKAAGYSEKTAQEQGSRLLSKAIIRQAIDEQLRAQEKRTLITSDYVLAALKEVAERCLQRVPVMEFDREAQTMVQKRDEETGEGVWEFDSSGANRALELLGKHLKLFTDKLEIEDKTGLAEKIKEARERAVGSAKDQSED